MCECLGNVLYETLKLDIFELIYYLWEISLLSAKFIIVSKISKIANFSENVKDIKFSGTKSHECN